MKKVSVGEAAAHFGVSKEAIHNRIRRGSLEVVMENGVKMILLDASKSVASRSKRNSSAKTSQNDERYYKLLQEQNEKLQSRVDTLENETRSLRDQKELMLIEERKKIEQIYKEKDEQLKNILSTLSSQFMLSSPEAKEVETVEVVEIEEEIKKSKPISLKKYLKTMKLSDKKMQKIEKKFKKLAKNDNRITIIGKKYYIDLDKYDYSDLF